MDCPSCGKVIQANRRECAFCGTDLGKGPREIDPDFAALEATRRSPFFKFLSWGAFLVIVVAIAGYVTFKIWTKAHLIQ